jgi:hypothetical protein
VLELCCDVTLQCGQSFIWKKLQNQWTGVIGRHVIALRENAEAVEYRSLTQNASEDVVNRIVKEYFRIDVRLYCSVYHAR